METVPWADENPKVCGTVQLCAPAINMEEQAGATWGGPQAQPLSQL